MKKISRQRKCSQMPAPHFLRSAIKRVSHHRVPDGRQMHTDLMSTASVDAQFQKRQFAEFGVDPLLNRIMCDRFPSVPAASGHASSSHSVATNAAGNRAAVLFQPSVHQGHVNLFDLSFRKLCSQFAMRYIVLGNHNETACLLIETMHDARPQFPPNFGELPETM